jgi:peptide/nickel transport system substrate-binding protein
VFGFDDTAGPYEYDPEKAKELLKEAGYPEGFEMQLFTILHARSYVAKPVQVAEVIAADLKAIGLNVEVKTYEYATLNELRKKLDYDVCIAGWYDVPYASNFLKTMALGGCKNGYEPPELVKLANKALGTYDRDEQLDYYSQLQHRLFEEAPIIPVAHNNYTAAIRSNVKGFELDIMGIVRVHNAYKE